VKVPKMVIVEVTNKCNLQCKYCPTVTNKGYPVGNMSLEMFKGIVDAIVKEFPADTPICNWMLGEPFMNPDYLEMCRYLSQKKLSFYVTTNLTIWNEELVRFLLSEESTCYQIIVSMDGLPWTNSMKIARPGTDQEVLLRNIKHLLAIKESLKSTKDFAVKICERGQDWAEKEEYIQHWLNTNGVDYVCMGKILQGDNEVSMRYAPCQFFDRNFMAFRWDGKLVLCDYNDKAVNEGALSYGQYKVGDSLLELYNNEFITMLRDNQDKGIFFEPCKSCSYAYTGAGFVGEIQFRNDKVKKPVYYSQDYYNQFFSLKLKRKPATFYTGTSESPKE